MTLTDEEFERQFALKRDEDQPAFKVGQWIGRAMVTIVVLAGLAAFSMIAIWLLQQFYGALFS